MAAIRIMSFLKYVKMIKMTVLIDKTPLGIMTIRHPFLVSKLTLRGPMKKVFIAYQTYSQCLKVSGKRWITSQRLNT